ncbi:MAG: response regulator [Planctomycetes bacterium]|nr:response regulator [Planctomycetota bacterium]
MKKRILFVDDEPNVLEGLRRMLRGHRGRWDMSFVCTADEALDQIRQTPPDVVVSDVMMPGKDGFALLTELRESGHAKDIPVVMLTGVDAADVKRRALTLGATDLLNKPVEAEDLIARLQSVLRLKSYQDELKAQNEILDRRVQERTAELAASRLDIIWRLARAAEFRDEDTGDHVVRVGHYCRVLAEMLGMEREFVETLFLASPLHDIGKIGVPDSILLKRGRLTTEEWEIMKKHCAIGEDILSQDSRPTNPFLDRLRGRQKPTEDACNPLLSMAASIALTHHERWDGTGYPGGLKEDQIPLESRIVAVADVYDALCSERPYKPAYSADRTVEIIAREVGRHFDPDVFAAFAKLTDEFRVIRTDLMDDECCLTANGALT